jgi:hypothetical protein
MNAVSAPTFTDADASWVRAYAAATVETFTAEFQQSASRFRSAARPIKKYTSAIESVLENGWDEFHAAGEAHNEMCIASALLATQEPRFLTLEYEPPLTGTLKTIDFRASTSDGFTIFVDVKTIKPRRLDRWDQFERASLEAWFPVNTHVVLDDQFHGGEIWHNWFAARSRMLEYAFEFEQKIRECGLVAEKTVFYLALCGEGFHWNRSHQEDFVSFYRSGEHRADDSFSDIEQDHITRKGIVLDRTITHFACMNRSEGQLRQKRLTWSVRPPTY